MTQNRQLHPSFLLLFSLLSVLVVMSVLVSVRPRPVIAPITTQEMLPTAVEYKSAPLGVRFTYELPAVAENTPLTVTPDFFEMSGLDSLILRVEKIDTKLSPQAWWQAMSDLSSFP